MNTADSKKAVILELLDHVFSSWWTVVAGLCLGLSGALVALEYLPKTYEATTKIFMTPPKIPQDMIRSTVTNDMGLRMEALREAMLSRPYMEKLLAATFGLPPSEDEKERLINFLRTNVKVTVTKYRAGTPESAGLFGLTFQDQDPNMAAKVVNTLADLYIQDNIRFRSQRAEETVGTMEDLAERMRKKIEARDREIAAFKASHSYEIGDHLDANLRLLETRQRDLEGNEKALTAAQDRLQILQSQQSQAAWGSPAAGAAGIPLDPYTARVALLQRELEALRTKYSDDHPEVKAKKRELDETLASGPQPSPGATGETPAKPLSALAIQLQTQEREVVRLGAEQQQIRTDIAMYKRRIEATPGNEAKLSELTKDYDVLKQQFRDYETKAQNAYGSQHIEETQQGETFEVIERATPPVLPVKPIPLVVFAAGLVAGLALFVAPGVLKRFFNPLVVSEAGLKAATDVPVLIALPRLQTEDTVRAAKRLKTKNIALSAAAVMVLAVVSFVLWGA